MEGQNFHTGDAAAPLLDDAGNVLHVNGVVGQSRDQNETHPDLDASGRQSISEGDRGGELATRHLLIGLFVPALDVKKNQVDVVEHVIGAVGAQVAGGVDAGVNPHLLRPGQEPAREGGLHEHFPA